MDKGIGSNAEQDTKNGYLAPTHRKLAVEVRPSCCWPQAGSLGHDLFDRRLTPSLHHRLQWRLFVYILCPSLPQTTRLVVQVFSIFFI